jgi:hypothetical protein
MGGSNLAFIELGKYAQDPSEENWASDVKTAVVHYNSLSQKVKSQLDFLIANGQQKIAIVVWFGGPGLTCIFHMHTVCPENGKLPEQARLNLQNVLEEISKRPFIEVQVRLGHQGTADIHGWTQWEEAIYTSNRDFILDVVSASEEILKDKKLKRYYDLGIELMGHPHIERSWYKRYLKQIWQAYLDKFPVELTTGFSFNHAYRTATYESLKIFDDSHQRPPRLGFDIYLDRQTHFQNIQWVLSLMKWGKDYPIFIQETYRNDPQIAQEIKDARSKLGLNILSVMQWPLDQNGPGHATSVDYSFDQYK